MTNTAYMTNFITLMVDLPGGPTVSKGRGKRQERGRGPGGRVGLGKPGAAAPATRAPPRCLLRLPRPGPVFEEGCEFGVCHVEGLGHHPRFADDRHEIRVPDPTRDDV